MPELPEVETVRAGIASHILNREIKQASVFHARAIRRHQLGEQDFAARLTAKQINAVNRRGKFIWLPFDSDALIIHLGMSGQCLVVPKESATLRHERIRISFTDQKSELVFVDQRTFGGMQLDLLMQEGDGEQLPQSISHIAKDPFDPKFDIALTVARLRKRNTEVKRALLDQSLVSGIGNIYADEALWQARIHPRKLASKLTTAAGTELLLAAKQVMQAALRQGGTSFDSLYVNVNGESGYFARDLNVYGREGEPCPRCARPVKREKFTNRSSHLCPRCQPAPKR